MQLALVEMQRRVQGRVPLPRIAGRSGVGARAAGGGRPLVRFSDIPLEWSDFRLTLRQTADILLRFEALERADYDADRRARPRRQRARAAGVGAVTRVLRRRAWRRTRASAQLADAPAGLDQVLVLALRPFLARCAEALDAAGGSGELESRALPDLRLGAGLRGHHARAPSGGCSAGAASRSGASRR